MISSPCNWDDQELSPSFRPARELPIVVLIGLTGVGKTTAIAHLAERAGVEYTLLPNRREIADKVIIAPYQRADGRAVEPVTDRVRRFEYTARYRNEYSGGMAHALSQLYIDVSRVAPLLIFDGLRGLDEVSYAVQSFENVRFIVLDAPDMTRLTRLLKRGDDFDNTAFTATQAGQNLVASIMEVPDVGAIFSEEDIRRIARIARAADINDDEVLKKLRIIIEERRNYDPNGARVFLTRGNHAPVLVIDTSQNNIDQVADKMAAWL